MFDSASFSRNHMEFYSVVFEEGAEPMVYVRDRQSANGTWVNDDLVGKGNRIDPGRLLEHNDKVTIKPHWSFKVKLLAKKRHKMTKTQKEETKAGPHPTFSLSLYAWLTSNSYSPTSTPSRKWSSEKAFQPKSAWHTM